MLVFEEPETHTLWLGKAVPRDWLAPGESALLVEQATTRYGRVTFSLAVAELANGNYSVYGNITLPAVFASHPPEGGLRLRIRAPLEHAGKLSMVSVGGKAWAGFDAAAETVDFTAKELGSGLAASGDLQSIVAHF